MVAESTHEDRGVVVSATTLARAMVRQLIELGVSQFVLSPGSRNAPLSIALYEASEAGLIELFVRIDERSAAFFALGLSKSSDKYVAVVCTSGTAVANYHPAALEAYHAGNKLLVISADRPERLRRTGANQTTLHVGLLAPIPTLDTSIELSLAEHLVGGPVHLNLQFDEPLIVPGPQDWLAGLTPRLVQQTIPTPEEVDVPARTLVVVGHDHGGLDIAEVNNFIKELGLPVIAEDPISIPGAIAHASLFLSEPKLREFYRPELILIIGRTTLSRSINALIAECERTLVIDPRTQSVDTHRTAEAIFSTLPRVSAPRDQQWIDLWHKASAVPLHLDSWSEQSAIIAICQALPDESSLFVASSRPIRDIEGFVKPRTGVKTYANRGLAGIDGNISTAFGISVNSSRSYAILGDITFLHDLSALAAPTQSQLTIFLIDNNGGGIFNTLPQAGVVGFEKIFATPHNLDLEKVVAGFGVRVSRVKNESDIKQIISHDQDGLHVVIVEVPSRVENAAGIARATQILVSALLTGANLA